MLSNELPFQRHNVYNFIKLNGMSAAAQRQTFYLFIAISVWAATILNLEIVQSDSVCLFMGDAIWRLNNSLEEYQTKWDGAKWAKFAVSWTFGFSGLNIWDLAWWFSSLRVFGLLSSFLLLFPQRFGRYV